MTARNMRPGLAHVWSSNMEEDFLKAIDATGGWPLGYKFAGFEHTSERAAGFCNSPSNDGWWTVVASADDYYLWKLSPSVLQHIVDTAIAAARITKVSAPALWIKNSRGHRATVAKATGETQAS